ncbi:uncharacterized protein LOC140703292 [Pogona vitticeps]
MTAKQEAWKGGGGEPVGAGSGRNRGGIQRIEGKLFATIKKGWQSFHQEIFPTPPSGTEALRKAGKAAVPTNVQKGSYCVPYQIHRTLFHRIDTRASIWKGGGGGAAGANNGSGQNQGSVLCGQGKHRTSVEKGWEPLRQAVFPTPPPVRLLFRFTLGRINVTPVI